jgi:hypothetical protein
MGWVKVPGLSGHCANCGRKAPHLWRGYPAGKYLFCDKCKPAEEERRSAMARKSDKRVKPSPRPLRAGSPVSEFARQVGLAIRAVREAKGYTLDWASTQTGGLVSLQLWSIYELGATEVKLKNALAIARALQVPLEELLPEDLREPARTGAYLPDAAHLLEGR